MKACAGLLLLQSQSTAGLSRYGGCFARRGCTLVNIRPPTLIMNGSVIDVAVLREQRIMKKD